THEKERLREWMWTVPAPVALDEGAEPAKELGVAQKTAEKAAEKTEEKAAETPADDTDGAGAS
ncbi:MAG: hypothetical protein ACRDPR_02145, partial [Nocardioidaceae bacterium]